MFGNKYLYLTVLSINLALGACYVNYDLFQWFEPTPVTLKTLQWHHVRGDGNTTAKPQHISTTVNDETKPTVPTTVISKTKTINFTSDYNFFLASYMQSRQQYVDCNGCESEPYYTWSGVSQGSNLGPLEFIIMINNLPEVVKNGSCLLFADDRKLMFEVRTESDCGRLQDDIDRKVEWSHENRLYFNVSKCSVISFTRARAPLLYEYVVDAIPMQRVLQYVTTPKAKHGKPKINVKQFNMKCPENELPSSIGAYEIPTQRDLVLFTQRTLLNMFNSYHEKTLLLLKDIKEATTATVAVEKKCHGIGKRSYKLCVKQVNKKFVTVTKGLVQALERQEEEVIALTEGKICNLTSMKTNPIQLIKILAMDEASLDFALPAFLRLLGGCIVHCNKPAPPDHRPRLRQMTDQELVVRHFLTSKNYLQLLNDKYV